MMKVRWVTDLSGQEEHERSILCMISWTGTQHPSPPPTCDKITAHIKTFIDYPMNVPGWPSHTQSIERFVKMVTEAAGHVYSHERREWYINGPRGSAGSLCQVTRASGI